MATVAVPATPALAQRTPHKLPTPIHFPIELDGPLQTITASNGFKATSAMGEVQHYEHAHPGGVVLLESPWGEETLVRYWMNSTGVVAHIEDGLSLVIGLESGGVVTAVHTRSRTGETFAVPPASRNSQR